MSSAKKKVAILGSGVGAMTTALELTQSSAADQYEITIYQMGWRLGGKGASGRNKDYNNRVEEHGLHIWAGIYDNAFRNMRAAYAEMNRAPGTPLATWREAFVPMGPNAVMDYYQGKWVPWESEPLSNDQLPGDKDAHLLLPLWSYVGEAIQLVHRWFRNSQAAKHAHHKAQSGFVGRAVSGFTQVVVIGAIEVTGVVVKGVYALARFNHRVLQALGLGFLERFLYWLGNLVGGIIIAVIHFFVRLHWYRVRNHIDNDEVRKSWIYLNFGTGMLRGLHKDDVVSRGFKTIEHLDMREWLAKHIVHDPVLMDSPYDPAPGASERSLTLYSPLALSLYDADFAFKEGDLTRPALSADAAVYSLLRLAVTWKGAPFWQLQAGMGDVVFTPLYDVLKKRGVKFEFFRKVKSLHVSKDGKRIEGITIARQAKLAKGVKKYDPLVPVNGLPCWPSTPIWGQLEDGDQYEKDGVNFENWYSPEVDTCELKLGEHFDEVVLGISLGGIPYVCSELITSNAEWKAMVDNLPTVATQSAQFWLTETAEKLGWDLEGDPSVACYDSTNFGQWADLEYLRVRGTWPQRNGEFPECISYVIGPLQLPDPGGKPQTRKELDQQTHNDLVKKLTIDYLVNHSFRIFKNAAKAGSFDWDKLVDNRKLGAKGAARMDGQYVRANVQPTERYAQSMPDTTKFRLHPGDSKFENLYVAGDWTWNSFNCGCVESATISAMLASHAMCGSPPLESIVGLTFGHPDTHYAATMKGRP